VIDQNPTPHAGGDAQEMRAIAPFDLTLVDQTDAGLVNRPSRRQRVTDRLTLRVSSGQAP
jgi:hypothetical protein